MFCTNCGKQLRDDARFCDGCGKPTVQNQMPPAFHPADAAPQYTYAPVPPAVPTGAYLQRPQKRGISIGAVVAIFTAVVLLLGAVAYLYFSGYLGTADRSVETEAPETTAEEQRTDLIDIRDEQPTALFAASDYAVIERRENRWDIDYENERWRMSADGPKILMDTICAEPVEKLDSVNTDGPCLCATLHFGDSESYLVLFIWENGKMEFAIGETNTANYDVVGCYQAEASLYEKLQDMLDQGEMVE